MRSSHAKPSRRESRRRCERSSWCVAATCAAALAGPLFLGCQPHSHAAPASAERPAAEHVPTQQHAHSQHASPDAPGAHGLHKDFSDAEAFSRSFDNPARDAWQKPEHVIEHLRIPMGGVVVDLGAGTGYFLPWLSEAVGPSGRVLALDVEPRMVEFMRARRARQDLTNVEPRQVAPDDPGLEPNSVDRVLIVNTWHHLDQRARYARKLADALRAGGEIWIVDFTLEASHGPAVRHRVAPAAVVHELIAGGLSAEAIEDEKLPEQYLVRARRARGAANAP